MRGGPAGSWIADTMAAEGVPLQAVPIGAETRTNIKIFDTDTGVTTDINSAGPPVQSAELEFLADELRTQIQVGDLVVLAGSLPPGAPADTYARLAQIVQGCRGLVVLDTSGAALVSGLGGGVFLAKPNQEEAGQLLGHRVEGTPDAALTAAQAIRFKGAEHVLLSLGKEGAVFVGPDIALYAAAAPVTARSTAGCGDALLAGVLAALVSGQPWPQAICMGMATAAASATFLGTSFADGELVGRLMDKVAITRIPV